MILTLVRSMRPKQWTKNLLVFAGFLFTIEQKHSAGALSHVILAFGLFCVASSAGYILNDVLDVKRDRCHPLKCRRPIASGKLPVRTALIFASILALSAGWGAFHLSTSFGLLLSAYIALTTAYSLVFKHVVIVDLLVLAAGFVIRAVSGAVVIHVIISPWLLLCTTLLALFIGLAKRRHELVSLEADAANHRKILDEYSLEFLDQMINITAASALMAYSLYTFAQFSQTASKHPYMMVTIPFVIYGIFRYLYLIHKQNAGGKPEQVLLDDRPLLINLVLWTIVVAIILKWADVVAFFVK